MLYKRAITFGRCVIPHDGHATLIDQMLCHAEHADVHLSGAEKNGDYDLRVLLLKHLCRNAGIPLDRVSFYKSPTITEAIAQSVSDAPFNEAVLVLGSDQVVMGQKMAEVFDTAFVINRRTNSSSQMRFFLDAEEFIEDLRHLYDGDEYSIALAKLLRKEEIRNEKPSKATAKTRRTAKACSDTEIISTHNCTME